MKDGIAKEFEYHNYSCQINAVNGHYCGYVYLPRGHRFYSVPYDEIPIECHGGLTYGEYSVAKDAYCIGFDCAHADDLWDPEMAAKVTAIKHMNQAFIDLNYATFKDVDFVTNELEHIVKQLEEIS